MSSYVFVSRGWSIVLLITKATPAVARGFSGGMDGMISSLVPKHVFICCRRCSSK